MKNRPRFTSIMKPPSLSNGFASPRKQRRIEKIEGVDWKKVEKIEDVKYSTEKTLKQMVNGKEISPHNYRKHSKDEKIMLCPKEKFYDFDRHVEETKHRIKEKKRKKDYFKGMPKNPEYQTEKFTDGYFKRVDRVNTAEIEIYFSSCNFPQFTSYFLLIEYNGKETKSEIVNCFQEKSADFKKKLRIKYVFEKRQKINVQIITKNGKILGVARFEVGQLVGTMSKYLFVDLVGGSIGLQVNKILKRLLTKTANELEKEDKLPKIRINYKKIISRKLKERKLLDEKHFIDYLRKGLRLNVIACVDFTASNKYNSATSESLHKIYKNHLNEYQSAIASICSILINYDDDKLVSLYGFGAIPRLKGFDHLKKSSEDNYKRKTGKLSSFFASDNSINEPSNYKISLRKKKTFKSEHFGSKMSLEEIQNIFEFDIHNEDNKEQEVSHFFPLTGSWELNAGYGIEGLFEIYNNVVEHNLVKMSGPTLFSPMLKEVNEFAKQNLIKDPNTFTILLILTDGVLHDLDETVEEIIRGSFLPISVIIVGVGTDDFEIMKILDSDKYALKDKKGNFSQRDLVQFIDYSYYTEDDIDFQYLAEDVLNEIPSQVCSYYEMIEKHPELKKMPSYQVIKDVIFDEKYSNPHRVEMSPEKSETHLGTNELKEYEFASSKRFREILGSSFLKYKETPKEEKKRKKKNRLDLGGRKKGEIDIEHFEEIKLFRDEKEGCVEELDDDRHIDFGIRVMDFSPKSLIQTLNDEFQ